MIKKMLRTLEEMKTTRRDEVLLAHDTRAPAMDWENTRQMFYNRERYIQQSANTTWGEVAPLPRWSECEQ